MRLYFQGFTRRVPHPTPHRSVWRLRRTLAVAIASGLAACGGSPTHSQLASASGPENFSGSLAWAALEDLANGPRSLGSDGAEAARSLITTRLSEIGRAHV